MPGKPFGLADWQRDFLENVIKKDISVAALSLPRGQGKTTFLSLIAAATVIEDLRVVTTRRTHDSTVVVPVYKPFRLLSFLSNGAYSKTLNTYSLSSSKTVADRSGNEKVSRGTDNGKHLRHRDDPSVATVLAVAEGQRRAPRSQPTTDPENLFVPLQIP